ncbi:MAG: helix-turn-helix transcriptional regulator [Alcaligenaceae bacterium]|nr:helix-turn-helix transcriptional regulator [Alcaligenaceae bacterium]
MFDTDYVIRDFCNSPFKVLTAREHDVFVYLVQGKANKVIAADLQVSQRTVEAHRARIFEKVKVRNAVELTHRYLAWQYASVPGATRVVLRPDSLCVRGSTHMGRVSASTPAA